MGFLDNSTNNIIVDAVLTAKGREALCKNDGSFVLSKFGLADDEVDYGIIRRFGRAVGAEKIEKNTPIMEAFTNCTLGPNYFLMGASDQTMYRLPYLGAVSTDITDPVTSTVTLTREGSGQKGTVSVQQQQEGGESIPPSLIDQMYEITADPNLVSITSNVGPPAYDPMSGLATWTVRRGSELTTAGGSQLSIGLAFPSMLRNSENVKAAGPSVAGGKQLKSTLQIRGLTTGATTQLNLIIDTQ